MEPRRLDPKTNQLNISQTRSPGFYVFVAKLYLDKFKTVELHSMGYAMNTAIKAADILQRYGYVKCKKLTTRMSEETQSVKPKLVIELERTPEFKKLTEEFNKSLENRQPSK
eukprot:TRINITY_DN796_c0_g1_i5.p2 TRINITY_DN796_c0_g1~~TRINITY_DN796_c0_g1_i5.p2  ORF type:complete len:112 (-),score=42.43 TRINITY_DN796_c0_g1_i5:118-453(-)